MREFEQMEMQYFVHSSEDNEKFEYWMQERRQFYADLGLKEDHLDWHEHGSKELAHYAKKAYDVYYKFPFGWEELEGIHNRTDFDLKKHQEFSSKNLCYFFEDRKEKALPYVIETAVGADRLTLAVLCNAYREETLDEKKKEVRVVMGFKPFLAPVEVAVLPLSKKEPLKTLALDLVKNLSPSFRVQYDESGSIGKRYRRQDEIGTPFCITVDFDSIEDKQVTLRHRDTMNQNRIPIEGLNGQLKESFKSF